MSLLVTILQWLLGASVSFVAAILVVLYIRGAFRRRSLFHIKHALSPRDPRFVAALKSLSRSLEASGNVIDFWHVTDEIQQARLDAIADAKRSIQFETFMMTPGKRADDFADAIARKALEGVKVQLLVDSWGTRTLEKAYWQRLCSVGVDVVFFNPFDWRSPANYAGRTHRKLLIIDDRLVLIGGAGISNLWDGTEKGDDTKPWFDIEFALSGPVVHELATLFQSHCQGYRGQGHRGQGDGSQGDGGQGQVTCVDMSMVYSSPDDLLTEPRPERGSQHSTDSEHSIVLITPGTKPSYRNSPIESIKQVLIASARQRVWLSSPYFLPNMSTRKLLIAAKQSGVDVRILTTSDRSDKKPIYYASYEVYGELLEADIQIFEYQPSMLHAKMLLIDSEWTNTGSANLDYRSFLHNDELDIVTNDKTLFPNIEDAFEKGFSQSEQITLQRWKTRSWLKHRILGNAVRLIQWQL